MRIGCFFFLAIMIGSCGGEISMKGGDAAYPEWLNEGVRIMPLGDSITEGYPDPSGGYRRVLYGRFIESDIPADFVGSLTVSSARMPDPAHEGHAGWTSYHLLYGREGYDGDVDTWLSAYEPEIILLMCGTNDLFYGRTAVQISSSITALVDHIRAARPAVHLFISTTPPCAYSEGFRNTIEQSNGLLADAMRSRSSDAHLHFVDLRTVISTDDLASDRLHIDPDGEGNAKIADAWFSALGPELRM